MGAGHGIRRRQAQAAAAAHLLGGEERLEDGGLQVRGDPHAGVGHREAHVAARLEVAAAQAGRGVDLAGEGAQGQGAALGHGVAGIDAEVEDHLLDLGGVRGHRRQVRRRPELQGDVLADHPAQHLLQAVEQGAQIHRGGGQGTVLPAEGQQLVDQGAGLRAGAQDALEVAAGVAGGQVAAQQLAVAHDHLQEVVEVVGDAAGQAADRLHLLGVLHLALEAPLLGDVLHQGDHQGHLAIGPEQGQLLDIHHVAGGGELAHRPVAAQRLAGAGDEEVVPGVGARDVGGKDLGIGAAHHLGGGQAGDGLHGPVPEHVTQVLPRVLGVDPDGQQGEELGEEVAGQFGRERGGAGREVVGQGWTPLWWPGPGGAAAGCQAEVRRPGSWSQEPSPAAPLTGHPLQPQPPAEGAQVSDSPGRTRRFRLRYRRRAAQATATARMAAVRAGSSQVMSELPLGWSGRRRHHGDALQRTYGLPGDHAPSALPSWKTRVVSTQASAVSPQNCSSAQRQEPLSCRVTATVAMHGVAIRAKSMMQKPTSGS